jgi:uncharacterized membrane protein
MSDSGRSLYLKRYLLSGILTVIPLWVTWVLFQFVFTQLSRFGMPWVRTLAREFESDSPTLAHLLLQGWFQSLLAFLLVVVALYLLGWAVNRVIGKRLLALFERFIARVPLVQTVYGSVKQLISVLQERPEGVQRVVLIDFPSPQMKAVGLVTRTMTDPDTGHKLAAVYVPTTPNPTSGYMEIVPIERLTSTDWTLDEAMNFLISGGAVGPSHIHYGDEGSGERSPAPSPASPDRAE